LKKNIKEGEGMKCLQILLTVLFVIMTYMETTNAYTLTVTVSPSETILAIGDSDTLEIKARYVDNSAQTSEEERDDIEWKYTGATSYSDAECTTTDTTIVLLETGADTDWHKSCSYSKDVTIKGLKAGINWIKFKMKYRFGSTGEGTEIISGPVKVIVYDIGFIDKIPDYSLDSNKDSDNFFLRQHDTAGTADYTNLDIYYYISPPELSVSSVKLKVRGEEDEGTVGADGVSSSLKEIDGAKNTDNTYKTGDELNVKWSDVRDTAGSFRDNRFYTVQLEVKINNVTDTFKTPLGDADTTTPGYQCKDKCLVIHDLVYKHRPVVNVGSGEIVATNGPIYPFSGGLENKYQLWKRGITGYGGVAWTTPLPNYSVLGSFPAITLANRILYGHHYDVLDASITNDYAGSSDHYIDVNAQLSTTGDTSLFHRGHLSGNLTSGNSYCFIQYWMFSTQSYSCYRRPTLGSDVNASFHHEGDWEMVQICIKLTGTKKSEWFRPHAATASQHYYGQTLAWRLDKSGPSGLSQNYVVTYDNGNRIFVYVAINGHATYFRIGELDAAIVNADSRCGTQIQYNPVNTYFDKTTVTAKSITDFDLIPLNYQTKRDIADWPGYWGRSGWQPGTQGPKGPFGRSANAKGSGNLNINTEPMRFHNECRKIISGVPQAETEL
jgi:hypothetical protein